MWNNNDRVNNSLTDCLSEWLRVSLFKFGAIQNSFQAFTKPSIAMIFFVFASRLSLIVWNVFGIFCLSQTKSYFLHTLYCCFFEDHVKWRRFNCTFLMCALTYVNKSCCYTQRQTGDFFPAIWFICLNRTHTHTHTSSIVQHLWYLCAYSSVWIYAISKSHRNVPLNNWWIDPRVVCEYERQNVSGKIEQRTHFIRHLFRSNFGEFIDWYYSCSAGWFNAL